MSGIRLTRAQVLRYRIRAQWLDRRPGTSGAGDPDVLDLGVQDSGTGGALWALTNRGADLRADAWPAELALVWSVRAAPHAYRRRDLPDVEAALRPYSPADAAKRILDASRPLTAAGIPSDEALAHVAGRLREIVVDPLVKGEVSSRLTSVVTDPYLRWCRPCQATHLYEMPFRLGALHAGLELEPGTSPPVLRPVPSWPADHLGSVAPDLAYPARLDLVRAYLHHLGPARLADVAAYVEAPGADIRRRWPDDVVAVTVDGQERWALEADVDALVSAGADPGPGSDAPLVRLLGPFDLFLQARDRTTIVPDGARHKALWPTLGRPGAVLADGEVVGTWRPRASGPTLRLAVDRWVPWTDALEDEVWEQAARLAAHRGVEVVGLDAG